MLGIQLLPSGEFWLRDFLFYTLPLFMILIYLIRRRYQYWSDKGISGPTPIFPLGNFFQRLLNCPKKLELSWAKQYGKMYGNFSGLQPTLTITDPELVKQVFVRDFHHFVNRRSLPELHHIWPKSMFMVRDQNWKRIRSISSPAFTTGKLRRMYPLLHTAVEQLLTVLETEYNKSEDVDIKNVSIGYTMAAIASTMFNINPGTNGDPGKYNEFRHFGTKILGSPHRFVFTLILPEWMLRLFGIDHPLNPSAMNFIESACKKIIQTDTDKKCMVSMMKEMSVSEEELKNMKYSKLTANENIDSLVENVSNVNDKFLTDNEIVAQMLTFFSAGFESTASTISNTICELAHNKDVQQKVQQEVDDFFDNNQDLELTEMYEQITKLPYLDAVVKEGLRKNPVVVRVERCLNSDGYKLNGIELEKGTVVELPLQAVQMNDKYWSEPEQFRPERFLPENKHKIVPYSYLPFGDGPRNCVGMRYALLEVRVALAHIIRKFSFDLAKNTPKQFTYLRGTPLLQAVPYPVKFALRAH